MGFFLVMSIRSVTDDNVMCVFIVCGAVRKPFNYTRHLATMYFTIYGVTINFAIRDTRVHTETCIL